MWELTRTQYNYITTAVISLTATIGIPTNIISLRYFTLHGRRTLSDWLTIALNTFDLLVCLTTPLYRVCKFSELKKSATCETFKPVLREVSHVMYSSTAFTTTLITVTRTVALAKPFLIMNKKLLLISFVVFLSLNTGYQIAAHAIQDEAVQVALDTLYYSVFLVMVILTALCSFILVRYLTVTPVSSPVSRKRSNHATVTVLSIATVFCVTNSIAGILGLLFVYDTFVDYIIINARYLYFPFYILYYTCFNVNSCVNPIIYMCRKEGLRTYILSAFKSHQMSTNPCTSSGALNFSYFKSNPANFTQANLARQSMDKKW